MKWHHHYRAVRGIGSSYGFVNGYGYQPFHGFMELVRPLEHV